MRTLHPLKVKSVQPVRRGERATCRPASARLKAAATDSIFADGTFVVATI